MSRQGKLGLDAALHREAAPPSLGFETLPAPFGAKDRPVVLVEGRPCAGAPHRLSDS